MTRELTIQTAAAFERINEALMGKTEDELNDLLNKLELLINKAEIIRRISVELNH